MDWEHQEFTGLALPYKLHSSVPIPRPRAFSDMRAAATRLSENIPFVRVDFYEVNGRMYFGEMTFYPASGFGLFCPNEWNRKLGEMIDIKKLSEQ